MIQLKKEDFNIIFVLIVLLIVSFFIIRSFIVPILFTFLLVYVLNPLYIKVKKVLRYHILTSLVVIIFFLVLFIGPLIYTTIQLSKEINTLDKDSIEEKLGVVSERIKLEFGIETYLPSKYDLFIEKVDTVLENIFFKVPEFIFNLFLIIFFYYYFSKNYNYEYEFIRSLFKGKKMPRISMKIKKLTYGIIYGQIFVRFIQALLGTLGFIIIGVNGAVVWGIMLFFVAFLPLLGTGLIWLPLAIFHILRDQYLMAVLIIIIGIIISTIDNLLLPYIISEKANIGPVITLISIIGGIQLFGLYGILLGPFILGVLIVLLGEVFHELSDTNPRLRKFIWTEEERNIFRKLKTSQAREEYIRLTNEKYEKLEKS